MARTRGPVAFLFLGETLLIPHLWPVVEALAEAAPDVAIDIWVASSAHATLLAGWAAALPDARIRRAPGFRETADAAGRNGPLPAKLPMLARLALPLARAPVAVCAEQTSLWLPALLPLPTRFIKTSHGAGSMSARDDRRRRAAWRMLVPSERERATYLERGFDADYVRATGYVKSAFRHRTPARALFADERPVLLYTPHWQRHRSSWWDWGREIVAALAAQQRWNVILAPHQRLAESAPEVREILAEAALLPHVHADLDGFATVDGSYTAAADVYVGDTSSQVVEYLARPRPCVFLNSAAVPWRDDPAYAIWSHGEVIADTADLFPAIARAIAAQPGRAAAQTAFAADWLGDTSGAGAANAAAHVIAALRR